MQNIDEKDLDIRAKVISQIFTIHKNIISSAVRVMEKDSLSKTEIMILFMLKKHEYKATDLAKEIGISASTLTGVVDRLVERGYVERVRDEKDRRIVFIKLGKLAMEKAKMTHEKLLDVMKNSEILLPEKWWTDLSENLESLRQVLEEKSKELR
ncbi:MarR family winged helix-turn-helix transcriptional regulator [Tepidibacter mesophilus]|uniref:MarR family winged helix-turn-helix transcriptional regulator n=1 Tax=Tepidibacter mesophilus TaxID=655607 RepID=UPI000C085FA2|nr:MarR family transcriptional regulator [Tepidibacter mesophilus]